MALPTQLPANTLLLDTIAALRLPAMLNNNNATNNLKAPPLIIKSNGSYQQRMQFALFIRILFKRLAETGDHSLRKQAQLLVSSSVNQRRRERDSSSRLNQLYLGLQHQHSPSSDMIGSIEVPLRELVGEEHWIRTHAYMRYYLATKDQRKANTTKKSLLGFRSSAFNNTEDQPIATVAV